jgi:hypothetical protein
MLKKNEEINMSDKPKKDLVIKKEELATRLSAIKIVDDLNFIEREIVTGYDYDTGVFLFKKDGNSLFNAILFGDMIAGGKLYKKYDLRGLLVECLIAERKYDDLIKSEVYNDFLSEKLDFYKKDGILCSLQSKLDDESLYGEDFDWEKKLEHICSDRKLFYPEYVYKTSQDGALPSKVDLTILAAYLLRKGVAIICPERDINPKINDSPHIRKITLSYDVPNYSYNLKVPFVLSKILKSEELFSPSVPVMPSAGDSVAGFVVGGAGAAAYDTSGPDWEGSSSARRPSADK